MFKSNEYPNKKPAECTEAELEQAKSVGWVTTYNMLNREAGPIWIKEDSKGGCCDPATETYWSS